MLRSTFGDLPSIKPMWTHDLESKKGEASLHKALVSAVDDLEEYNRERKQEMLQHLGLYKGIHIDVREQRDTKDRLFRDTHGASEVTKFKKIIINHLRDVTDSAVSRLATFKPSVAVLPNHGVEFQDKAKAVVTESWMKSFTYENDVDKIRRLAELHAFIFGESFVFVPWDERKGDIIPSAKKLAKMKKKVKVEVDGDETEVTQAERLGDVGLELKLSFNIFLELVPSSEYDDVNYLFDKESEYIDMLKLEYPDKADMIQSSEDGTDEEDHYLLDNESDKDKVEVFTLWHRATREIPEGLKIRFTRDVILEKGDLPFEHGELPFERLTKLDIPGELRGVSPYVDLKALQGAINNLYSIMIRDRSMAAPKLMIPSGSVDPNQNATNKPGVIQYKGGVPPSWSVPNLVANDLMLMIERLEQTFEKLSNSSGTRRGDTLPNVEAFKAFGFFEEQATKRDSTQIAKHRKFLERLYRKILLVAAENYTNDDQRMIKMLGKHNQYLIESFDTEDLKHGYDIRVTNTSALPESKAQRISTVIELHQAFPDAFTQDKALDLVDMSSPDAFFDLRTAAVNAAESENAKMLKGQEVREPQRAEELLVHWETHVQELNNPTTMNTLPDDPTLANLALEAAISSPEDVAIATENPEEGKKVEKVPYILIVKHLLITEGLIYERALKNPTFASKLLDPQFEAFPTQLDTPMTISDIVASHNAALSPEPVPTGVDQQVTLPSGENPNDLAQA